MQWKPVRSAGLVWGVMALLSTLLAPPLRAWPSITQFSPTFGAPGTVVTVLGSDFVGVTEVLFGQSPASFSVVNAGRITAVVPWDATTGSITVNGSTGSAMSFDEFTVAPRISGFTPATGVAGDTVVVDGANFIPNGTTVRFSGVNASAVVTAASQLQATVPAGAQTGPVVVSTFAGASSSGTNFIVLGPGPTILGFTPASGSPGEQVVITGLKFTGVTAVRFNGTNAAFAVTADTQIVATVPPGATTGPISVVSPKGTAFTDQHFQVIGLGPILSGFAPAQGPAGTSVTLTGRNFIGATAVRFNGANATFAVTADTQIQTTVPTNARTGPISVVSPWGTNVSAQVFTVMQGPVITDFSPTSGQVGDEVIITGERFTGATFVKFAGASAPFTVTADTQIHATVPGLATNGPISVATPSGTNTSALAFVVLPPGPQITGFTPVGGPPGTAVILEGRYLMGATEVRFNGTNATFAVTADSQIHTTVPTNATAGPITVVTSSGTNVSTSPFYVRALISSFAPASGGPGLTVGILGANFLGVSQVTFSGTPADFVVDSLTQMRAVVPLGAVTGPITVTTPGGTAVSMSQFAVGASLISFEPTSGPAGTVVRLVGSAFTGTTQVRFNGVNASFVVDSSSQITAVVPQGASSGLITVVTPQGVASSLEPFLVTQNADLTLALSDGPGPAIVGNLLTYVISVVNRGPSAAPGVTVTNVLPPGVRFVTASSSQGSSQYANGVVSWSLGSFGAGLAAVCTAVVAPDEPGLLTNSAWVLSQTFDSVLSNNVASIVSTVSDPFGLNLIRNGDAESGQAGAPDGDPVLVPGWQRRGGFTVVQYGASASLPSRTSPGPIDRGLRFFWGGSSPTNSSAAQEVWLTVGTAFVDTGRVTYDLGGFLGGATDQSDGATLQARFYNAANQLLGAGAIGPVTPADRTNTTGLYWREAQGNLPIGTRRIEFRLDMGWGTGPANDASADNLSFVLDTSNVAALAISRAGTNVVLSWPAISTDYALQFTTRLPPLTWGNVGGLPTRIGSRYVLTNALGGGTRFFRLRRP